MATALKIPRHIGTETGVTIKADLSSDLNVTEQAINRLDTEHNSNGTHKAVNAASVNAASVNAASNITTPKITLPDGTITSSQNIGGTAQTLSAAMSLGKEADLGTNDFALTQNGRDLLRIDAQRGLAGMLGNISNPLTHIPMQRQNDALRLSGVETFTRASGGTYIDSLDGLVKTAAVDVPRYERMADGGICWAGEPAGNNYFLHSDFQGNANFTVYQVRQTVGASILAPDGVSQIEGWEVSVPNAVDPQVQMGYTNTNGHASKVYTFSFWVKGVGVSVGKLARAFYYANTVAATPFIIPAEWTRMSFTATVPTGDTSIYFKARVDIVDGNIDPLAGKDVVYLWGGQLEISPAATSLMSSVGAAFGSRSEDRLSIQSAGNTLLGADSKTIIFDITPRKQQYIGAGYLDFFTMYAYAGATSYDMFRIYPQGGISFFHGSGTGYIISTPADVGTTIRICVVVDSAQNKMLWYKNGARVGSRVGNLPTNIGSNLTIRGVNIGNLRIYDRALTDAEVGAA